MAPARVNTIESLRYCPPGEWGKILGLDRIPEARTLREMIRSLVQAEQWSGTLSRKWMAMFPESTGVLYIDGHGRVYNGSQTGLPRHRLSALFTGHQFGVRPDAYPAKIQTIGIETGRNRRVRVSLRTGVQSAGDAQPFEVIIVQRHYSPDLP
jgi:hypothetical protein